MACDLFAPYSVKAVPNGALAWHIDNAVTSRVSRFHYGISIRVGADKDDRDQKGRKFREDHEGKQMVSDAWSGIVEKVGTMLVLCVSRRLTQCLHKNVKIQQGKEFSKLYILDRTLDDSLIQDTKIYVYRRAKPPKFVTFPGNPKFDDHHRLFYDSVLLGKTTLQPGFDVICKITADLTECAKGYPILKSLKGTEYRKIYVCTLELAMMLTLICTWTVQCLHRFRGD
jgi:hypothetical protein